MNGIHTISYTPDTYLINKICIESRLMTIHYMAVILLSVILVTVWLKLSALNAFVNVTILSYKCYTWRCKTLKQLKKMNHGPDPK